MKSVITLAIADDHVYQTELLAFRLSQFPDINLLYSVADGNELVNYMKTRKQPDVVLMDVRMPEMGGMTATIYIKQHYPKVHIIGYSQFDSEETIAAMLFHGAAAFVLKASPLEEIVNCIEEVYAGTYSLISHTYTLPVLERLAYMRSRLPGLSPKMLEILRLICQEYSNKEIAELMNISIDSVKNSRKELFRITGSKNMIGLLKYAVQYGYVSLSDRRGMLEFIKDDKEVDGENKRLL